MSSSAVQLPTAAPRRHLTERQAQTVHRLCEAAVAELEAVGHQALTVRSVAKRADVAPATAYTYFASKEHLVAEVFWRRIEAQDERPIDLGRSPADRVTDVLLDFALVVADETDVAAACTVALLADDVEVRELREKIGRTFHRRLVEALGGDGTETVVQTLELATTGALVQVGTGHLGYEAVPEILRAAADLMLGARS